MLHYQAFQCNMLGENAYLLWDDDRHAAFVDCGAFFDEEKEAIAAFAESRSLIVEHHYLTHGHFDHVFGADFLAGLYGANPQLSQADEATYHAQPEQMQLFMHRAFPLTLPPLGASFSHGDRLSIGNEQLEVIATPGHTPGGVCLYCAASSLLLSGDSLFRGSIGRTDLPGGSHADLVGSLRQRVLTLPPETVVLPGHGPATDIGYERACNPYL